jgi:plasmid replication initiation protein
MQQPLLPERREQLDFFVCDIFDATPKDDLGSMEHPMFTLSKNPDRAIRHYEHNGNSVTITPSVLGHATIFDKDVLIYCISQLVAALNQGRPTSRTVRVTAYDLLKATNREVGGDHYKRLEMAMDRLSGTRIKTDITTGGERIREGFGIIDRWKIIERSPTDKRMVAVEITLSKWLYNAVQALEVLTIHRDYFRLKKPIERRLYELARKHCGIQGKWTVGLALLHKKTGSRGPLKKFRDAIRTIIKHQHLPEYRMMFYEADDKVTFYSREAHGHQKQVHDILAANRKRQPLKWG